MTASWTMRIAHRCSSESELTYEHDEFTPSPGSEENPDKFLCTMMKVNNFIFLPLFLFKEKKWYTFLCNL